MYHHFSCRLLLWAMLSSLLLITPDTAPAAASSVNIPLNSPLYGYLDKLAGMGLIAPMKGIRPFSKIYGAKLFIAADSSLQLSPVQQPLAVELIQRGKALLSREIRLLKEPSAETPLIDAVPVSTLRLRVLSLDGVPRNYERQVHDPGGDGVFGIGGGLRPTNLYPTPFSQRGSEGTPLQENNNGIIYRRGANAELRWGAELHSGRLFSALVEPALLYGKNDSEASLSLNRAYLKAGYGSLDIEVGRDENWLGFGYRGGITLTSNAKNFDQLKLSSPEPFQTGWLSLLGDLKYAIIVSRFDETVTDGELRQPWFYAVKLSAQPTPDLEIGFNLGRQVGGPGIDSSAGSIFRGLIGGMWGDNSNSMAGFEARYRFRSLRNAEIFGEFSGEDAASFWPIVESYLAGIYLPRLTDDGRNDFRFEYFYGNQILYASNTFPAGYTYRGLPIGHSQGGATQDFFLRYCHWFSARNTLALEYIYTDRGRVGQMPGQVLESKHAGRIFWRLPLQGEVDAHLGYGIERVSNLNLVEGVDRTNQILTFELMYRY